MMDRLRAVVHCKRDKFDVYIGRGSKWGNPFKICTQRTREQSISLYQEFILTRPELMEALPELRGKTLGCWCAPLPCHGDILFEMANRPDNEPR